MSREQEKATPLEMFILVSVIVLIDLSIIWAVIEIVRWLR
jgi:hypothetical protein